MMARLDRLWRRLPIWLTLCLLAGFPATVTSANQDDPMRSVQWDTMQRRILDGRPFVFDPRVKVLAPTSAEDSMAVPVFVDASEVEGVSEILVFADLNPIPEILRYIPVQAAPRLGFRFKVQQATPIRAAALSEDGVWHVGQIWLEAAGGGCTLPSLASGSSDWESHLGEVSGRIWRHEQSTRLRFTVVHPMDTGLAPGIPRFHLEEFDIRTDDGVTLARLETFEPVSENPVFSLDLKPAVSAVRVGGRDNSGNRFDARVSE